MTISQTNDYPQRLGRLVTQLASLDVDAFVLPTNDAFQSEYPPECAKRLQWISGFSGSAGMGAFFREPVDGKRAALFTDGRYTLQAAGQVAEADYHIVNHVKVPFEAWLKQGEGASFTLGYDPWLHSAAQVRRWKKAGLNLKALESNPVDAIWEDRPAVPAGKVRAHPLDYAGESSESKRRRVGEAIKAKGADAALLCLPDGINWLLNIRGEDIDYNPLVLCYGLLKADGSAVLYLDARDMSAVAFDDDVVWKPMSDLPGFCEGVSSMLYDPAVSADWFRERMEAAGVTVVEGSDPTLLPKACKNQTEVEGMRAAHRRDGKALTRFLRWLDDAMAHGDVTEMAAEEKLESLRVETGGAMYHGPSFATITGAGPNGAIVHYRVSVESNRVIGKDELYLVDSGGQYDDGTTDVTRTIVNGTPTDEMKDRFTRVLKGHIALAMAVFPEGTTGAQLDALARYHLWQDGVDYDHGTGHGVGAYLCVHEGPQGISKKGRDVPLVPGMILSNEPGYYKNGEYGIRIENLVLVVEKEVPGDTRFFAFETLTLAPIDKRLIDETLLTQSEKDWLVKYHQRVEENMK